MSIIIETDLKELLIQINGKLDKLSGDVNELKVSVTNDINELKVSVANDINELKVSVGKLDEGQKGINKRLENVEFFNRSILAGIIVGIILGIMKMFFPNI